MQLTQHGNKLLTCGLMTANKNPTDSPSLPTNYIPASVDQMYFAAQLSSWGHKLWAECIWYSMLLAIRNIYFIIFIFCIPSFMKLKVVHVVTGRGGLEWSQEVSHPGIKQTHLISAARAFKSTPPAGIKVRGDSPLNLQNADHTYLSQSFAVMLFLGFTCFSDWGRGAVHKHQSLLHLQLLSMHSTGAKDWEA